MIKCPSTDGRKSNAAVCDLQSEEREEERLLQSLAAWADAFEGSHSPEHILAQYGLSWMCNDDGTNGVMRAQEVDINASIEHVWSQMNTPFRYSNLAVTLSEQDKACARLKVLKGAIPKIVCNSFGLKSLYWSKPMPLTTKVAERFHVLIRLGPNRTRSYIGTRVPGCRGKLLLKAKKEGEEKLLFAINKSSRQRRRNQRLL